VEPPLRVLVLASRNPHKLREVRRILSPWGLAVEPLPERVRLPPELGDSFVANALPKARTAALALACPAIADDSGIEAEALAGAPGHRSARYAGEHATDAQNLQKLLAEAPLGSRLRYVCTVVYAEPPADLGGQPLERVFRGDCTGRLGEPRGSGGFGYDPAFVPADGPPSRTMAELSDDEKDAISHRGRALRAFAEWFTARTSA
jgi:XTP/dITP diphosphohydrolase